jgi:uncharacterized alpha-E superfamily protein
MGGRTMIETAISVNRARQLYWKGRYLQRTQIILRELLLGYEHVIDGQLELAGAFYHKLGITTTFNNGREFLYQGVYGTHSGAVASLIAMARENAIESRNLLDEREFARLNSMHNRLISGDGYVVTPEMLEDFIDDITFILGVFSAELGRPKAYNLIRLGQRIERFDMMLRLYDGFDLVNSELETMNVMAKRLNAHYIPIAISTSDVSKALCVINSVIDRVIQEEDSSPEVQCD